MTQPQTSRSMAEKLALLPQTGPGTEMGDLLRRFWHPIARSGRLEAGAAKPVRVLGEELTLYRGESGTPYLVGARCPHRRTVLHTAWVQSDRLRCMYHGWQFDGAGACTDRPAERETPVSVRIPSYPVRDYCGLVFAYLGDGEPPPFDLPRKDAYERPGALLFPREETWPCNWFQQVENSMDAVHVSFVHHWGEVGAFGSAVATTVPELSYEETEAGLRQTAVRSAGSRRVSDWTFPNNNHISVPGLRPEDPWIDVGVWMTPVDDERTARFVIHAVPSSTPEADQRITDYFEQVGDYNPADHHDELFGEQRLPDDPLIALTSAQDYVAAVGQGAIVDRAAERLGRSDMGIAFLRRIFWRELEAVRTGQPGKDWRSLDDPADMPHQKYEPTHA